MGTTRVRSPSGKSAGTISFSKLKKQLKHLSPSARKSRWGEWVEAGLVRAGDAHDHVRAIERLVEQIAGQTPTTALAELYEHGNPRWVGQWPPGGLRRGADPADGVLMRRAKGEKRLYPAHYLTTSGHSYETLLDYLYTGETTWMIMHLRGTRKSVLVRIARESRRPRTIEGELLLILSPHPATIKDLAHDLHCSPELILRGVATLQRRRLRVMLWKDQVWVRAEGWAAFRAAAGDYERSREPTSFQAVDLNAEGYRGGVVDVRELPAVLRKLFGRHDMGVRSHKPARLDWPEDDRVTHAHKDPGDIPKDDAAGRWLNENDPTRKEGEP